MSSASAATFAVYVSCIDESSSDACLYIDEVEFDDACDVSPVFLVEVVACAFFGC